MKIIITGINGFIGSQIANRFINNGHEILGIGRQHEMSKLINPKADYLQWDLRIPGTSQLTADVIIHSAALANDFGSYSEFYENNVTATKNLLHTLSNIPIFIYVSTSSVYQFNQEMAKEGHSENVNTGLSNYGKTKLIAENTIREFNGIPFKFILRPRSVYGKCDRLILPKLLNLIRGGKIVIPKHLTKKISLTHIENFIDAVELCINNPHKQGTYNITDDVPYDLNIALPGLLKAATGMNLKSVKIPRLIWEVMIGANELMHFSKSLSRFGSAQLTKTALLDITNAKVNLGYAPKMRINDSFLEINQWVNSIGGWEMYRDNPTLSK